MTPKVGTGTKKVTSRERERETEIIGKQDNPKMEWMFQKGVDFLSPKMRKSHTWNQKQTPRNREQIRSCQRQEGGG